MGIYSNGEIYGISLVVNENILFKKIYNDKIDSVQIEEIKEIYNKLSLEEKDKLVIQFYLSFCTTYSISNTETFMSWVPSSKDLLEKMLDKYLNKK